MFNDAKHFMQDAYFQAEQAIEKAKSTVLKVGVVGGLVAGASSAFAAGPDLSTVTAAVDFGTVIAAVLLVAAALIGVYVSWKGARLVINAVKGG